MSSSEELETLTRRFYAALDAVDLDTATQLTSPDVRACMGGQDLDRDSWMATGKAFMTAFPDGTHEIQDLIVSGNQVTTRCVWSGTHQGDFMGIPASKHSVAINVIHIDRWVDGRIAEHFGQFDSLGLMQQLGAIPG
jgi:steroid delta-isomerase-like uncharacterized protein